MMKGGIHPSSSKKEMQKNRQASHATSGYNKNIERVDERLYSDAKNRQARKWNSKVAHTLIKQEMGRLNTSLSKSQMSLKKRKKSKTRSMRHSKTSHKNRRKLNSSVDHQYDNPYFNTSMNRSMNTTGQSSSGVSASNRLYYGGIQNKMSKELKMNKLKQNKMYSESAENVFQPQINDISRRIATTKKIYHGDHSKVEERL